MWSDRRGSDIHFCRLEDTASLLWSVNHGKLEMHPLLSLAPDFDTPTALVFDLDPGEGAEILDAAEIALLLHDMLAGVNLDSFAKSSGSKGVQMYMPLNTPTTFGQTKAFSRSVAEVMAGRMSVRVVARVEKRLRTGKAFVDWARTTVTSRPSRRTRCERGWRARPSRSRSRGDDLRCREVTAQADQPRQPCRRPNGRRSAATAGSNVHAHAPRRRRLVRLSDTVFGVAGERRSRGRMRPSLLVTLELPGARLRTKADCR